jgi:hypothetical protein
MSLHGSTTELQNALAQLYLKFKQRFSENALIRELWSCMAHDISQQMGSFKSFPSSFWLHLGKDQKDQDGLTETDIQSIRKKITENKEDKTLQQCFETALQIEEPTIIKVYIPIIRNLRTNWTDEALDFYIMVKAHLARITRATGSFSGNPIVIRRSNLLQQNFEKEILMPQEIAKPPEKIRKKRGAKTARKPLAGSQKASKKQASKKPSSKIAGVLAKHAKIHHSRTKPMVKNVRLQRRRAHR